MNRPLMSKSSYAKKGLNLAHELFESKFKNRSLYWFKTYCSIDKISRGYYEHIYIR